MLTKEIEEGLIASGEFTKVAVDLHADAKLCIQVWLLNDIYIEQCYPSEFSHKSSEKIVLGILTDFADYL